MILSLGGFKFKYGRVGSISIESDFGISENSRIKNYPAFFKNSLGTQTITIDGNTLPYNGDKQNSLKKLYELANAGLAYSLVTGHGKYLGKFIIIKISENRSIFTDNGLFFTQSFTLELKRDFE